MTDHTPYIRCRGPWPSCGHPENRCTASPAYQAAIKPQPPAEAVPSDTVVVPRKPTPEMVKAGVRCAQNSHAGFIRDAWNAMLSAAPRAAGEPVKKTMTLHLTDAEMVALEDMVRSKELDRPKIFRDSFKLYQAVERGAASVTWHESGPLGLPYTYPAPTPATPERLREALEEARDALQFIGSNTYAVQPEESGLGGSGKRSWARTMAETVRFAAAKAREADAILAAQGGE